MSSEPEQERNPAGRHTGGSMLNRLVNLAGFWMAIFSLAGLMMLTVAGPIVQKRMSRRAMPTSNATQTVTTTPGREVVDSNERLAQSGSQSARAYSLDGLRWMLAGFAGVGMVWTCCAMLKPYSNSAGSARGHDTHS